jgi:hypothetical protein
LAFGARFQFHFHMGLHRVIPDSRARIGSSLFWTSHRVLAHISSRARLQQVGDELEYEIRLPADNEHYCCQGA